MRSNLETIVGRVRRTDPSIWTKFCFFNLQFKTSGIYTAVRLHWLMMVYKSFKNVVKTSMTPLATPLMSQFFVLATFWHRLRSITEQMHNMELAKQFNPNPDSFKL